MTEPRIVIKFECGIKQVEIDKYFTIMLLDNGKIFQLKKSGKLFCEQLYENQMNKLNNFIKSFCLIKEDEIVSEDFQKIFVIDVNNNLILMEEIWMEENHQGEVEINYDFNEITRNIKQIVAINYRQFHRNYYFLLNNGIIYWSEDYYDLRFKIKSNETFTEMINFDDKIVILSDKDIIYELKGNNLIETNYRSIDDYLIDNFINSDEFDFHKLDRSLNSGGNGILQCKIR